MEYTNHLRGVHSQATASSILDMVNPLRMTQPEYTIAKVLLGESNI